MRNLYSENSELIDNVSDIISCLNTNDSIYRFLSDIHNILQKVTFAENFYVVLFKKDMSISFPYFRDEIDNEPQNVSQLDLKDSLTVYALNTKKVCNLNEQEIKLLVERGELRVIGSMPKQWLCFPLNNHSSYMGAFIVQSYRDENEYSQKIIDILYTISHVISSALDAFNNQQTLVEVNKRLDNYRSELENQVDERTKELSKSLEELKLEVLEKERLQKKLEHDSLHDSLTDLPNRKYLFNTLNKYESQSSRENIDLYILYLDLDDFKPINDSLGHRFGDVVLQRVADRLRNTIRYYDFICRLGGDEFVVVICAQLQFTTLNTLCEKLLTTITAPIQLENNINVTCGLSIGVASNGQNFFETETLLHEADTALYIAKSKGKNQIHYAEHISKDSS